ncbi:MAG: response regulator [Lachnospiraceae bacterium]|nr:response regulator [Lachnospiraceae bacterium]
MKIIKIFFTIFSVMIFGYFFVGIIFFPKDAPSNDYQTEVYNGVWEWIHEDGSVTQITLPVNLDVKRGETVIIRTMIDEYMISRESLCFHTARQDMKMYAGDELRVEYSTKDTRFIGKYTSPAYVFFDLKPEDAGKYLTVEAVSDSTFSGVLYPVTMGSRMSVWYGLAKKIGPEMVVAVLTLLLGILSTTICFFIGIVQRRKLTLMYLGCAITLVAVWLVANIQIRQLIFPAVSVINNMTFAALLLLPIPFIIYMDKIQKEIYHKLYLAAGYIAIINCGVCLFLHIFKIIDFSESFIAMAITCFITITIIIGTMIKDVITGRVKEYFLVALGMLGIVVASTGQIIVYFMKNDEFHTTLLSVGLIYMLFISIANTLQDIMKIDRDKKAAEMASEAEARFLANMSHEIRTPINTMLGMNTMILRESKEPEIRKYSADVKSAGETLLTLVNDILDLSRIRAGRMEIIDVEYNLVDLIYDCINMVTLKASEKKLKLNIDVESSLPSVLSGDEMKIRQVIVNLLSNAVKYTNEGSVNFCVKGKEDYEVMYLTFIVEDTGIGIKPEDMERLFGEYQRIEEYRNRNVEGTGLGMSITKSLLAMMGSRLEVESEYSKGSKFSFTIKQRIVDPNPIGEFNSHKTAEETEDNEETLFLPGMKVLVVDDNKVNCRVFTLLLKKTEMKIDEVYSGEAMLKITENNEYDIIFLDHMMPDMDGIETLRLFRERELKKEGKKTKVVALTANAIQGARELYISAGFDEFLTKPIQIGALEDVIKRFA